MYLKQIEQLVVLQKVDDEIILLRRELEDAPREVAELEKKSGVLEEEATLLAEKIELLKAQRKRLDSEIEDNDLKIRKSKNKLMMVGNTREYHAMLREMDGMEKINRTREEEHLALAEELERQSEAQKELKERRKELEADLAENRANLDSRVEAAGRRLAELDLVRRQACEVVPRPILGRYEFIRSRISNPVIVPVSRGVCGGCHISIPPQIYNDLQKGEQIIS